MAVRLFVGNLPYSITEADLREHFSAVGPVSGVWLPTDRETGRPRGFGFVEFEDRAVAEEAIRRFNNQPLGGRQLAVNEARPPDRSERSERPERPERPAGGPPPRSYDASGPRPGGPPRERPAVGGPPPPPRAPRFGTPGVEPPPFSELDEGAGRGRSAPRKPKKRDRNRDFDRVRGPKKPLRAKGGGRFYSDEEDDDLNTDDLDEGLEDFYDDEEEGDDEPGDEPGDGPDDEPGDEPKG